MSGPKTILPNPPSGMAEYRRIERDLRDQVAQGRWTVGAMLPSRRDLAREYKVSLVTLDRAIGPLLADGTLRADDRRGTFLARLNTSFGIPDAGAALASAGTGERTGAKTRTGPIGIIASLSRVEGQDYFILHELEQFYSQKGRSTFVLNRSPEGGRFLGLAESLETMLREELAALIVICLDIDTALIAEEISRVDLREMPTVCILAGAIPLAVPHVFYDNRSGGYQAAHHLLEKGWKKLTVVAPFTASWVTERIAGVRDGLTYDPSAGTLQVLAGEGREWDSRSDPQLFGRQAAEAAFEAGWQADGGIICVNDGVAFGVRDAAAARGLEAGRDFAILGFDDEPYARTLGLTSVRPPMQGMAREAARLLADHMQGVDGSLQIRLRAHVISRASTDRHKP